MQRCAGSRSCGSSGPSRSSPVTWIGALVERGAATVVSEVRQREFPTADPFEMAEGAPARLQESLSPSMPVLDRGKLMGLLTAENPGGFLMIQTAFRGGKTAPAA